MSSLANVFSVTEVTIQERCLAAAAQATATAAATTPAPFLPNPTNLERNVKYRHQCAGETTLRCRSIDDAVSRKISAVCRTPEITFCQLLIGAGVLSESSILAAMEESYASNLPLIKMIGRKFKIPRRTCISICLLVEKLQCDTVTFNESVLATKYMCEFRSSLAEALRYVCALAQQSIISFLQVVGLVSDAHLLRLTDNHSVEPTRLAAMLVTEGIIGINVLRNATRLRYWLKTGACDFATTNALLIACMRQSVDVEHCLGDQSVAA